MIKGMKIALQLYSVRDFAEKDFKSVLEKVKEMGYEGVEFAGLNDCSPEEVRDMLNTVGLEPVSAHIPIPVLVENPAGVIADYKKIGCRFIAIPWLEESCRPGNEDWDKTKADIAQIAVECEKQGVTNKTRGVVP